MKNATHAPAVTVLIAALTAVLALAARPAAAAPAPGAPGARDGRAQLALMDGTVRARPRAKGRCASGFYFYSASYLRPTVIACVRVAGDVRPGARLARLMRGEKRTLAARSMVAKLSAVGSLLRTTGTLARDRGDYRIETAELVD